MHRYPTLALALTVLLNALPASAVPAPQPRAWSPPFWRTPWGVASTDGATAFVVADFARSIDRSRLGGLPVHAVENQQNDIFLACRHGHFLQSIDIGLVEVVGLRVVRIGGYAAVESLKFLPVAIDAPPTGDAIKRHAIGVDRY